MDQNSRQMLAKVLKLTLAKLKKGLNDPPYNYVIHTAPFKREKLGYWKSIDNDYHWHIEIMPRLTRVAGFEWGTGFYICPLPPENAAEFLRGVEV
jgi:UDPglucose--hexose-1-phosphate uridylyltransferase